MDYYDGNTVTGLWNYAQHYAINDNSFGSHFGPSTPGALNLVSGQTHGVISVDPVAGTETPKQIATPDSYALASPDANGVGTVINDPDPAYDDCSDKDHTATNALAAMQGRNIGDLLNDRGRELGLVPGRLPAQHRMGRRSKTTTPCAAPPTPTSAAPRRSTTARTTRRSSTTSRRPTRTTWPPKSVAEIGHNGRANHNYDLTDFDAALKAGNLPAVSFLKAAEYQDGHAGYSDPTDEQHFLVKEINALQKSPVVEEHRGRRRLRRLRRLVRPRRPRSPQRLQDTTAGSNGKRRRAARPARPRSPGATRTAAGPAPGSRCWSSRRTARSTPSTTPRTEQTSITSFIEDNWSRRPDR